MRGGGDDAPPMLAKQNPTVVKYLVRTTTTLTVMPVQTVWAGEEESLRVNTSQPVAVTWWWKVNAKEMGGEEERGPRLAACKPVAPLHTPPPRWHSKRRGTRRVKRDHQVTEMTGHARNSQREGARARMWPRSNDDDDAGDEYTRKHAETTSQTVSCLKVTDRKHTFL